MDEQIQRLRDAGFTDADIAEWVAQQNAAPAPAASGPVSPAQSAAQPAAPADVPFVVTPTPVQGGPAATESNWPQNVSEGMMAANAFLSSPVGHALEGAGLSWYGGKKALEIAKALRGPTATAAAQMPAAAESVVNGPARTVMNQAGRPITVTGPAAPAAPQGPGVIQRGMDYARQMQRIAAEKVMQGAQAASEGLANAGRAAGEGLVTAGRAVAPYARAAAAPVAVGLTAALMPGNAGGASMMVPQTGRLRGSDLNPMTGRPWTAQELQAYNANPNLIDSRLPR